MSVTNVWNIFWRKWVTRLIYSCICEFSVTICYVTITSERERIESFLRNINDRVEMLKQCLFYLLCAVLPSHDTEISTRCVNVIRSCMSELTFHLLQPQLQISFTDDLSRENASRMYISSTYGIYFLASCLASICQAYYSW